MVVEGWGRGRLGIGIGLWIGLKVRDEVEVG